MATPAIPSFSRNKKITICVAGSIVVIFLISLLVWGGGSSSRKPSTPPKPQAQQQQQQSAAPPPAAPAKPSPMAPAPAATSATLLPAARPARAPIAPATSSPELVRELKRINSRLGEINRRIPAEQAGAAIKALGEIAYLLEQERQQTTSISAAPPARPRRERLSDRELERRYKERLLSQEP